VLGGAGFSAGAPPVLVFFFFFFFEIGLSSSFITELVSPH